MFWNGYALSGLFLLIGSSSVVLANDDKLEPSYPKVPPDYQELQAHSLVADARVSFPNYYIDWTNGYRVTTPSGTEFVVNSITQPKCAFYANYVSTDEEGHLGVSNNVAVNNSVYIGEVNFENCQ